MEPIISPWIIYWINVLSNLKVLVTTLVAISIVMLFTCIPLYFCIDIFENVKDKIIRVIKILIIVFGISISLYTFIPDKNDMIGMVVINYITPDNINLVQDNMAEFIKRIMNIIQSNSN